MYVYIYTHMCIQCQPNIASVTFDFGGSILDGQFISGLSDRTPTGSRGSSTFDCVCIYIYKHMCRYMCVYMYIHTHMYIYV